MDDRVVRPLESADLPAAAEVLAAAFVDEPVFVAALPDRQHRIALCPPLFAANLRHARRFGEVLAVAEAGALRAVAYWTPRPEPALTAADAADLGFAALAAEWADALGRLGGLEAEAARTLAHLPAPWRYLGAIGVQPEHQGRGFGSAVLRRILADAWTAGQPVGLITDRTRNLPFYRRAGFVEIARGEAAGGESGVHWWSMAASPS